MRILFVIVFTCLGLNIDGIASNLLERNKRFVIFPFGGSYKLVIGIGIPVMLAAKHKTLVFASNIQFQYPQITNLTQVQQDLPPLLTRRRRRRAQGQSEWTLTYLALEALMDKYGINGKECLLRSICDNAMYSLHHDSNGLYGQLLHIILTPNFDTNDTISDTEIQYIEAKKAGEFGIDCMSMYTDCPLGHSLLDLISILE